MTKASSFENNSIVHCSAFKSTFDSEKFLFTDDYFYVNLAVKLAILSHLNVYEFKLICFTSWVKMYQGFVGTVLSHFLSLISTLWAFFMVHGCNFQSHELKYIYFGLFLVAANSSLALVRYGTLNWSMIFNYYFPNLVCPWKDC